MNIALARILDLMFAGGEIQPYHRDHNQAVILMKSSQNTSSRVPTRMMLPAALLVVKVSEKVLGDLEVFQVEMGVQHVGKIDVMRNVLAHLKGLNFLEGAQNWTKKHQQEIQTAGVDSAEATDAADAVGIAGLEIGSPQVRKETGQRMQGIDCCRVFHLGLQPTGFAQDSRQKLHVGQHYVCWKSVR
jgi:hypothetical protein